MYRYKLWIRRDSYTTFNTIIMADNDWQAKMVAEGMFGIGNVLSYTRLPDWEQG